MSDLRTAAQAAYTKWWIDGEIGAGLGDAKLMEALRQALANRIDSEGIAPKPYVPMTGDEAFEVTKKLMDDGHGFVSGDCICAIEATVIKRAGLDVVK